ncbi:GyrI-like domain-containing protein [Janibacter alittae]|uniref:GyrI-like domain-containing protein n=1 Tax=Janibacter alittae TaxID=3115209 RepID=A0ABZ2MGT0_9MICO
MPAGTAVEAPLEVHEVPEQQVVMARVEGPFTLIVGAHAGIEEFVAAEGPVPAERHGLDDPIERLGFNRSLSDPSQTAPEDLLTEVCVPLA